MKIENQNNNFIKLKKILLFAVLIACCIKANAQCTASFTYTVNPANNGEATFTNTSTTDSTMRYYWDFGDGTFGYDVLPFIHTFNGTKTFNVCLTINDSIGRIDSTLGCYKRHCDTIHIINTSATCNARFSAYNSSANDSLGGVYFTNYSSGTITNYLWDFGDGTSSTLANPPVHNYLNGGSRVICLNTTNPGTLCNSSFCDTIFTSSCKASFTYSFDTISNSYSFSGSSTGASSSYSWNFGDGITSSLQNPNHLFAHNGGYQVCLTVTSLTDSTCSNTRCQYVNMTQMCDASFHISRGDSTNLLIYVAYVNYDNGNSTYLWDLGDGTTSTLKYPTHNYAGSGPYRLCLTVTGSNSCTDTYCDSLYAGRSSGGLNFTVIVNPNISTTMVHTNNIEYSSLLNYPNPFSKTTNIVYSIKENTAIELSVIDMLGQQIAMIDKGNKTGGNHTIQWNAENIAPGIYLLQLKVNDELSTKKLIITQ